MFTDMDEMSAELQAELAALEAKGDRDIDTSDAPEMSMEQMFAGRRRSGSGVGLVSIDPDILADFRRTTGQDDPTTEINRVLRAYTKTLERNPAE
ncbi:hypothetical protein [Rhizobium sp. FKL33]|uniref:hypothetical protein n=1 Tax=Rhizobium sp. FKL33 TaxID=2562307 RepID=UPI0010BF9FCE|nr:hypothetical protein [Rhizobium sp. FKL33]